MFPEARDNGKLADLKKSRDTRLPSGARQSPRGRAEDISDMDKDEHWRSRPRIAPRQRKWFDSETGERVYLTLGRHIEAHCKFSVHVRFDGC